MPQLKPVVYLKIGGEKFHWASTPGNKDTPLISFSFEETDGTDQTDTTKKGKRDELKFTFLDYDPEKKTYLSDRSIFKIGTDVKFYFGFTGPNGVQTNNLNRERWMKIVDVTTSFPEKDAEICTVTCYDLGVDLNAKTLDVPRPRNRKGQTEYTHYSVSEVVREIAKEEGFGFNPSPEDKKLLFNVQKGGWQQKRQTNMQFLQELASKYGANVFVERRVLFFQTIGVSFQQPTWGYLYRGLSADFLNKNRGQQALVLSFEPKTNLQKTLGSQEGTDVDTATNMPIQGKSESTTHVTQGLDNKAQDSGQPVAKVNKTNAGVLDKIDAAGLKATDKFFEKFPKVGQFIGTKIAPVVLESVVPGSTEVKEHKTNVTHRSNEAAEAETAGQQQSGAESSITADVKTLGHPFLVPKKTTIIAGRISRRWKDLKWYIRSVQHTIDKNGYFCDLQLTATVETGTGGDSANKNTDTTKKNEGFETKLFKEITDKGKDANPNVIAVQKDLVKGTENTKEIKGGSKQ